MINQGLMLLGNSTHEKASSVTQDKNIIDTKRETSQNKLTNLQSENNSNTLVEKVKNKGTSQDSETKTSRNSATEKSSSLREHKTITKVTRSGSDNQPEKQSVSSDSMKRDRALFFKYLNSNTDNVKAEDKIEIVEMLHFDSRDCITFYGRYGKTQYRWGQGICSNLPEYYGTNSTST